MRLYTLIYMSFFGIFLVLFITYSEIQTYIEGFLSHLAADIRYQHQLCAYHIRVLQLLVKFSVLMFSLFNSVSALPTT